MMIFSGTVMETATLIRNDAGALIEVGTRAMVIGNIRESEPVIYLCETLENDEFEREEFYCYANQLKPAERVAC